MEEPLVVGRHQLAVVVEQALGPEQEQGVVERAGALGLALVDADRAVEPVLAAGLDQAIDQRPGDIDRVLPEPLPEPTAFSIVASASRITGVACTAAARTVSNLAIAPRAYARPTGPLERGEQLGVGGVGAKALGE
jgi:hypothetical protein